MSPLYPSEYGECQNSRATPGFSLEQLQLISERKRAGGIKNGHCVGVFQWYGKRKIYQYQNYVKSDRGEKSQDPAPEVIKADIYRR